MTVVPQISEKTAERQVSAARARVTRTSNEHMAAVERGGPRSLASLTAEARYDEALRKLAAAEARLDAIRSQRPERHPGAWPAAIPVTPEEDEAWGAWA